MRIEKERLEKEKVFLIGENQLGKDEIQEKAKLLEDIKNTYTQEIKEKEEAIDLREEQIEKIKDEQEDVRTKFDQEKEELINQYKKELVEVKQKLEEETAKREEIEEK